MTDIDEQVAVPRCYMTALADGTLVSKTDARIATCGELDELSAHLGAVCAALKKMTETVESIQADELRQIQMRLHDVQRQLFVIGARVVGAQAPMATDWAEAAGPLTADIAQWIQRDIRFRGFILPAGSSASCHTHIARTVCRRAERSMVALQDQTSVEYLNVLSKYLFHLALFLNQVEGVDEIIL